MRTLNNGKLPTLEQIMETMRSQPHANEEELKQIASSFRGFLKVNEKWLPGTEDGEEVLTPEQDGHAVSFNEIRALNNGKLPTIEQLMKLIDPTETDPKELRQIRRTAEAFQRNLRNEHQWLSDDENSRNGKSSSATKSKKNSKKKGKKKYGGKASDETSVEEEEKVGGPISMDEFRTFNNGKLPKIEQIMKRIGGTPTDPVELASLRKKAETYQNMLRKDYAWLPDDKSSTHESDSENEVDFRNVRTIRGRNAKNEPIYGPITRKDIDFCKSLGKSDMDYLYGLKIVPSVDELIKYFVGKGVLEKTDYEPEDLRKVAENAHRLLTDAKLGQCVYKIPPNATESERTLIKEMNKMEAERWAKMEKEEAEESFEETTSHSEFRQLNDGKLPTIEQIMKRLPGKPKNDADEKRRRNLAQKMLNRLKLKGGWLSENGKATVTKDSESASLTTTVTQTSNAPSDKSRKRAEKREKQKMRKQMEKQKMLEPAGDDSSTPAKTDLLVDPATPENGSTSNSQQSPDSAYQISDLESEGEEEDEEKFPFGPDSVKKCQRCWNTSKDLIKTKNRAKRAEKKYRHYEEKALINIDFEKKMKGMEKKMKEMEKTIESHNAAESKLAVENAELQTKITKQTNKQMELKKTIKELKDEVSNTNKRYNSLKNDLREEQEENGDVKFELRKKNREMECLQLNLSMVLAENEKLAGPITCSPDAPCLPKLQYYQKLRDKFEEEKVPIQEEANEIFKLLTRIEATSEIRDLARFEKNELEESIKLYEKIIGMNILRILKTKVVTDLCPLPKYPKLSEKFMSEYQKTVEIAGNDPNNACYMCTVWYKSGDEIAICKTCKKFVHKTCGVNWSKLNPSCGLCREKMLVRH